VLTGLEGADNVVVIEQRRAAELTLSPERLDLARTMLRDHVDSGLTPTIAAVVLHDGRVVVEEAVGNQRPDGPPLDLDHMWPIASAGKPILAATVLSLVEEGRIGVMEPVVEYFPELAGGDDDAVLVHHLLTHTTGWQSDLFSGRMLEVLGSGEAGDPPAGVDFLTHLCTWVALHPIRIAPVGDLMVYGNMNYALLGELVRRVTGGTLDGAVRERVFEPLGMERSALVVRRDEREHLVHRAPDLPFGSAEKSGVAFQGEMWEACDLGEMGMHLSPRDLARFGQAILDGGVLDGRRVLSASTVRSMCIDQIPGVPAQFGADALIPVASWGYGFAVACEQRWPYFGGGLIPPGSVMHPGAGGIDFWVDFDNGIVGVLFEILTEMSPDLEPLSGLNNRFQDVITGAVQP
jgi:serine-type D-Ala-D-Ala carboxypeptidase